MDSVDGIAFGKGLFDHHDPHISGFRQFMVDVLNFHLMVAHKTMHALSDHADTLLDRLLKGASNGHHLTHRFHTGIDQLGYSLELIQIPAWNLTDYIIQCWFKESRCGFGYGVPKLVQTESQSQFSRHKSQWIAGSLAGQG